MMKHDGFGNYSEGHTPDDFDTQVQCEETIIYLTCPYCGCRGPEGTCFNCGMVNE